jgi:hypothetical protein
MWQFDDAAEICAGLPVKGDIALIWLQLVL